MLIIPLEIAFTQDFFYD